MRNSINEVWFDWFYKEWEAYQPCDLLDKGINPSKIAESFIRENEDILLKLSEKIDYANSEAFKQFIDLSESELYILKYFLKLLKLKRSI